MLCFLRFQNLSTFLCVSFFNVPAGMKRDDFLNEAQLLSTQTLGFVVKNRPFVVTFD